MDCTVNDQQARACRTLAIIVVPLNPPCLLIESVYIRKPLSVIPVGHHSQPEVCGLAARLAQQPTHFL